jgi:integrase/recombinase XerD
MNLSKEIEIYICMRQQLGFKLQSIKPFLQNFGAYIKEKKASHITTKLALAYAMRNPHCSLFQQSVKLRIIRRFALYLHTMDPRTEVPPEDLLVCSYKRPAPYIYTDSEICKIQAALLNLPSKFYIERYTQYTLFGLLAVTGMRISEALSLRCDSVDLKRGLITIRESKYKKSRKIPIHASVKSALKKYAVYRDKHCAAKSFSFFFVTERGKELRAGSFRKAFATALVLAGLKWEPGHKPRVMDLRHTFAVRALVRCHKERRDATTMLVTISTYLGHENPANTYWYFSATPELLRHINNRLNDTFGGDL